MDNNTILPPDEVGHDVRENEYEYCCKECGAGGTLTWADSKNPFCSECKAEQIRESGIEMARVGAGNKEKRSFSVHKNIIKDLIFRQHCSIQSALSELIQNAHDAGAKNVWLKIDEDQFICRDDGKGFRSLNEITDWFEVFGSPREKEDEFAFGRFRMGRGQVMGLAVTEWRSGEFRMRVDVKNDGLDYELSSELELQAGCTVSGCWYDDHGLEGESTAYKYRGNSKRYKEGIRYTQLDELIDGLSNRFKYVFSLNIHINGELISSKPSDYEWTIIDDEFYFLRTERSFLHSKKKVKFFNLGVRVDELEGFRDNGIVVTRKHLRLNMTRSKIQEDCPLYCRIRERLRKRKNNYNQSKKYDIQNASQILEDYCVGNCDLHEIIDLKIVGDIHFREVISLNQLARRKFTIDNCKDDSGSDIIEQAGRYFVVNGRYLPGDYDGNGKWNNYRLLSVMRQRDPKFHETLTSQFYSHQDVLDTIDQTKTILESKQLTKHEQCVVSALMDIYNRKFFIGYSAGAEAWTDGHSYVAIDRNWLKKQNGGMEFAIELLLLVTHEFSHIAGETDNHDIRFYRQFHDKVFRNLSECVKLFLRRYDDHLASRAVRVSPGTRRAIQAARRGGKSKV